MSYQINNFRRGLITANEKRLCQYNIDSSRFSSERITYLSIGNDIYEKYGIVCPIDIPYWSPVVDGFNKNGTLFDYESGKRLPQNANVVVEKYYHLILREHFCLHHSNDVVVDKENSISGYSIYKVQALKISKSASDFFMRFSCRLSDKPAILTLLYPFAVKSSHIITHTAERVWFHKTNGFVEVRPKNYESNYNSDVFSVDSGFQQFQQIIYVSRFEDNTSVLRYAMLRKVETIEYPTRMIDFRVYDNHGISIEDGEYDGLPPNHELNFVAEFDGFARIYKDGVTINKVSVKAGEKAVVNVIHGCKFHLYQGLDCIYEISFVHKKQETKLSDDKLIVALKNFTGDYVNLTHSFGAIAERLTDFPKTTIWLRNQIKNGKIDRRAKLYLQSILG
ncbi:hypothetical protein AGMMS49975_16860 [Clostridia bacterium]|nr:hypothetical protein AGMMS49975_16860 [Clostridia bacterium]